MSFNLLEGQKLAQAGIGLAVGNRKELYERCKNHLVALSLSREDGRVTADDSAAYLISLGQEPTALGNAAGGLFKGRGWVSTGEMVPSERTSNHGHMIRVWRYEP